MGYQYHMELSRRSFRQSVGNGRNGTSYFDLEAGDAEVRRLHAAACALAKENGIDVASGGLCERERTAAGCLLPPTPEQLRQNIAATRRVLDALRLARVDYREQLGGSFSLAGYLLDSPSWDCQILDNEKLIACRWQENYVGRA